MTWQETYGVLVATKAAAHDLDSRLVMAVIEQESGGNPWAGRYEKDFRWLWNVATNTPWHGEAVAEGFPRLPGCSRATELEWQRTSWGLGQVMGAVGRERGFKGAFLSELADPAVGLEYACRHLSGLIKRAKGDIRSGLLRYNGGGNMSYPDEVLARMT